MHRMPFIVQTGSGQIQFLRQVFKRKPGMGSKAAEHAPRKRQNNIKHSGTNYGRRFSKINLFDGLSRFRYAQQCHFIHASQ
jgi:hypothetical protein